MDVKRVDLVEIENTTMGLIEIGLGFYLSKFTLNSNGLKNGLGLDPPNLIRLMSMI